MSWDWQKTILPNGSLEVLPAFYKVTRLTRVARKTYQKIRLSSTGLANFAMLASMFLAMLK